MPLEEYYLVRLILARPKFPIEVLVIRDAAQTIMRNAVQRLGTSLIRGFIIEKGARLEKLISIRNEEVIVVEVIEAPTFVYELSKEEAELKYKEFDNEV